MRILVVDDHDFVRRGICSVLAAEPTLQICGEAVDGRDAVKKAEILHPEIVVMDISMPNMNGLEATREIKRLLPAVKVVIVSQHDAPEMVRQAYNAGAGAYVMKSAISTELLAAIDKVRQGTPVPTDEKVVEPVAKQRNVSSANDARSHVDEVLQQTEKIYRAIGESIDYGVWVCDAKGRNIYASPSFLRLVGMTQAECSKLGWAHFLHPDEAEKTLVAWNECVQKGTAWNREQRFLGVDGKWHHVLSRGAPIKDGDGKILNWAGINLDIQENKETEAKLIQLVQTLEAKISDRSRELQNVGDKLRELSAKLLQTQDEERRRIARELHDGVGQLLAALNMNLSKISDEKNNLSPQARQSVDESSGLIEQASREIRTMSHLLHPPLLDEVGLESALRWYVEGFSERSSIAVRMELNHDFGTGLPRDLALALFRIVQECLVNVHRHSGSPTALVAFVRSPSEIILHVQDEGHGILPEIQSRISSGEGSGVGLRGMRERIRQFGGRLEVHSDEKGTRITAALPIPGQASELENRNGNKTAATAPAEASHRESPTILCIDDEAAGLLPRKLLLQSAGYRVIEARTGAEGIRLFQAEKVDIVILDYWMSGMKGTTVASELRRINPAVPIIVLSGLSDLPGESAGLIDRWIVKGSARAEQLLDSISSLLERRPA